jgi:hypothetical protein
MVVSGSNPTGPESSPRNRTRWSGRRIAAAVVGAALIVLSALLIATGAGAALMSVNRDGGYVDLDNMTVQTDGYALADATIVSDEVGLGTSSEGLLSLFGTARVRVVGAGSKPIFVGIAPADKVAAYLRGVESAVFKDTSKGVAYTPASGGAPAAPGRQNFWIAQSTGTGTVSVVAPAQDQWIVVVMNADGSRTIGARVYLDATFPTLPWLAAGLVLGGLVLLAAGVLLIVVPRRRSQG